jgi:hypothetical protein
MKKEKVKFICVSPLSSNAKNYFYIDMDNLHSCRVKGEKDGKMYLESLNKNHPQKFPCMFWLLALLYHNRY